MSLLAKLGGGLLKAVPGVGTAASLLGMGMDIFNRFRTARKQKNLANQINPVDPEYQTSEYAKQGLARASQLYNSRMPGASAAEKNIANAFANQQAAVERSSTNSADSLYMAAAGGAGMNEASANLAQQEAANQLQREGVLSQAENRMIGEGDKVFNDRLRKYTEAVSAKNDLMNASYQNRAGAWNTMAKGGLMLLGSGMGQGNKSASGSAAGGLLGAMQTVGSAPMVAGGNTAAGMNPMVAGAGSLLRPPGRSYRPNFINPLATINEETRKRLGL
jgi:hypothetical protein